jgi:hypothetical protein
MCQLTSFVLSASIRAIRGPTQEDELREKILTAESVEDAEKMERKI